MSKPTITVFDKSKFYKRDKNLNLNLYHKGSNTSLILLTVEVRNIPSSQLDLIKLA